MGNDLNLGLTFDKGLQFPQTFPDLRYIDARISQPKVKVILAFQGAAKMNPRACRYPGFFQYGPTKVVIIGQVLLLHRTGDVRI